jgi:hypothetical protein
MNTQEYVLIHVVVRFKVLKVCIIRFSLRHQYIHTVPRIQKLASNGRMTDES